MSSDNSTDVFFPTYSTCSEVTELCPVSATIYGDYFTTAACAGLTAAYAALALAQAYFAGRGTSWTFTVWLGIGTAFELLGYGARTVMSYNPWNFTAFLTQNLMLTLGPTFTAAATSVTFKFIVVWYGAQWSAVRPGLLPYIMVGTDMVSILVQAAGGGLASVASGSGDVGMLDVGQALMIGGVIFQVANMVLCGGLMLLFWHRRRVGSGAPAGFAAKNMGRLYDDHNASEVHLVEGGSGTTSSAGGGGGGGGSSSNSSSSSSSPAERARARRFVWGVTAAYVFILVRCIYRVPDMAMGYGSDLQKNEALFLVLEGGVILGATAMLTFMHPARMFTFMTRQNRRKDASAPAFEMK